MLPGKLDTLKSSDFDDLASNAVRESRSLDFKRDLFGGKDDEKREFLADVSSFANTIGGDLVFGVDEEAGVAVAADGVAVADPDSEILRLESILRTGLEPRLPNVGLRWIERVPGRGFLVVRVPRSWAAPHRVIPNAKFFGRSEAGKYPLDVAELRSAFLGGEALVERVRRFRTERAALIQVGEGALPLWEGARVLFHIIPLSAFTTPLTVRADERSAVMAPLGSRGFNYLHTLEGFATYTGREGDSEGGRAYTLVYRSGIVEAAAVVGRSREEESIITPSSVEGDLLEAFKSYIESLRLLGVTPPFYAALSLVGVRGYRLLLRSDRFDSVKLRMNKDVLFLPEIEVTEEAPDAVSVLRPAFDLFWNAFGYSQSFSFDRDGNYQGRNY